MDNATFLRMDNFTVAYDFGKVFTSKANLRATANVQNVFVVSKYKGLDPDINLRTSGNDNQDIHMGIDEGAFPVAKSYNVGLRVGF